MQGFYLCLPFQLANPPGFHATHIPKRNLVYVCQVPNASVRIIGLHFTWALRGLNPNTYRAPVYCEKGIPILRVLCNSINNLQKFRAGASLSYITHRSSGYCGSGVQNLQKFGVGEKTLYPYPGYCGTGAQNLHKFRVRL